VVEVLELIVAGEAASQQGLLAEVAIGGSNMPNGRARLSARAKRIIVGKPGQVRSRADTILGGRAIPTMTRALGRRTIAGLKSATRRSRFQPTFRVGGYPRKR